jgi:hypothetical protein
MAIKANKPKLKRLSPSQRIHVRRMKQIARDDGTIYRSTTIHQSQAKVAVKTQAPALDVLDKDVTAVKAPTKKSQKPKASTEKVSTSKAL